MIKDFPDGHFAIAMNAINDSEWHTSSIPKIEELNKKQCQTFYALLRDHGGFASTTLGILMNRWGIIEPPNFRIMDHLFFVNLINHILSSSNQSPKPDNGEDFTNNLLKYLCNIGGLNFSLTELIFQSLPKKIILWVTRGRNNSPNITGHYLYKSYIFQIMLPKHGKANNNDWPDATNMTIAKAKKEKFLGQDSFDDHIVFNTIDLRHRPKATQPNEKHYSSAENKAIEEFLMKLTNNSQFDSHDNKNLKEKLMREKSSIVETLNFHNLIPDWTDIIYIPSAGNINDEGIQEGAGGIILYERLNKNPENIEDQSNSPQFIQLFNRVKYLYGAVQQFYSFFVFQDKRKIQQHYAGLAASSAIMARNMSHNIGSHVLPKAEIALVRKKLTKTYCKMRGDKEMITPMPLDVYGMIDGIKTRLDRYIQYKSDFLAEITTEPLYSTRNALFFKDVMSTFLGNTLLIDNIAAMEGLGYEKEWYANWDKWREEQKQKEGPDENPNEFPRATLRIRCFKEEKDVSKKEYKSVFQRTHDETEYSYGNVFVPLGWRDINSKNDDLLFVGLRRNRPTDAEKNVEEDVEIALPGPIGEFALYGFLENVIRNAAKHNKDAIRKRRENDPLFALEIHLVIKDDPNNSDDYFRLSIYDNISDPGPINNKGETPALCRKLQNYFDEDLVDDAGCQRRKAWGLAEMMICANLLAGSKNFKYDSDNLSVGSAPLNTGGEKANRLVYHLRLMKPKKAVLIGKSFFEKIYEKHKTAFKNAGICYFDSFKAFGLDAQKATSTIAIFGFALIAEDEIESLEEYRRLLPFRILRIRKDSGSHDVTTTGDVHIAKHDLFDSKFKPENFMHRVWQVWLQKRWNQPRTSEKEPYAGLDIYLGQTEDTYPTKSWQKKVEEFSSPFHVRLWGKKDNGNVGIIAGDTDNKSAAHVVFDRHGEILDELPKLAERDAYIMLDKLNSDFSKIFQPPLSKPWVFPYELIEAGLLRVLILDERMAERAVKTISDTDVEKIAFELVGKKNFMPSYWHIAWRSQVLITTHLLIDDSDDTDKKPFLKGALHAQSFEDQHDLHLKDNNKMKLACPELRLKVSDKKIDLIINSIGRKPEDNEDKNEIVKPLNKNAIDVVLIHQGIIDNLPAPWREKNKFIDTLRQFIPWIIVESGRGIPPEVQQSDEKFLPFSVIDHWLEGKRIGKFSLAQTVMTLTRGKKE